METLPTVTVTYESQYDAIRMTWQKQVTSADVHTAFSQINRFLETADREFFVIVDILSDPNFPITATLNGALFGPYRNSRLKAWLILGSNPVAHIIDRTLKSVTGRSNVFWFETEAAIMDYLQQQAT